MEDSAAVRLARELDAICERNVRDVELVALCERLLLHLGELEKRRAVVVRIDDVGNSRQQVDQQLAGSERKGPKGAPE